MEKLSLDLKNIEKFVTKEEYYATLNDVLKSYDVLMSQEGEGNDFNTSFNVA